MSCRLSHGQRTGSVSGKVSKSIIRYLGFLFQTAPADIVAEPQQITVLIGHLTRDVNVIAVEVVHFLTAFAFGTGVVVHLREQFIAVGIGVDIGIPAV